MLGIGASVVLLGFGAASAWAAPASHTHRAVAAAHGFAGVAPAATPASYDPPFATFSTDPVDVTINSVVYQMTVNVNQDLSAPGNQPELDVDFDRQGTGKLFGDQNHDYAFAPASGISFTYDATNGKTAALKATAAIAPSAVSITYMSTSNTVAPCKLQNGTTGDQVFSNGTVKVSQFSLVSGTSPFFGTVTTKPKTGSFFYDPGCKGGGGKLVPICPGAEDIEVGNASSAARLSFANDYGDSDAFEGAFESSTSGSETIQHTVISGVKGTDLPAPTTGATSATATVKTTRDPFMTGTATFTSSKAPKKTRGSCKDESNTRHTYTQSTYTGKMASGSPILSANFDTDPFQLSAPAAAKLYVVKYTS